jgi:prevent-host-death family protein
MSTLTTVEARKKFSEVINRAAFAKERTVLTRHGKKLGAVVPVEDLELLEELESRLDLTAARAALAEAKRKGSKPLRALMKELGL